MRPPPMAVPAALLSVLFLTACAGAPAVPQVQLIRPTIPAALLTCLPEPAPPPPQADDAALARYILSLADAGADCRDRLDRVRGLVGE